MKRRNVSNDKGFGPQHTRVQKVSIMTPILVMIEVIMECAIPFVTANLVNEMQAGCTMDVIVRYGVILIIMAIVSLIFGGMAGSTCATASAGFARNPAQGYAL